MSPEQAMGERDVDARADVYAIGAVLFEMLSGQPPYTGATPQAVLAKSLTEEVPPLATVRPGIPATVAAVVAKATARRPADRYGSGVELEQALAAARDAVRSGATLAAKRAAPATGQAWGLFGIAAVASVAVIYGLVSRWGLASWTLGLAVGLLAIGAGVLLATGRFEAQRQAGHMVRGIGGWFTWGNAARGGGLAGALWVAVALVLVFKGPGSRSSRSRIAAIRPTPTWWTGSPIRCAANSPASARFRSPPAPAPINTAGLPCRRRRSAAIWAWTTC
jgi:hypothetical protein